ncbi:MAG: hypothetical protein ACYCVO_15315 [Acidimicrobiales bacterium]
MSRGRAVRFPAASELPEPPQAVPVIGPVVFSLSFSGMKRTIDLSDLACQRLVRPLAAALASIGGDDASVRTFAPDFQQMTRHLRAFVSFLAGRAADADALEQLGIAGLSPQLLDAFEADLLARFGPSGKRVQAFMSSVVRLLRLVDENDPGALGPEMQARLGYASHLPHYRGAPLDAYPIPVFEAIRRAALGEVAAITARIEAGRLLAASGADPERAGWLARENVLFHIAAHGPLVAAQCRSQHVVRCAPGGIAGFNSQLFLTPADLVPLLVALICLSGLEPDCAKSLRADCLSSPARGFVSLAYEKKRAHTGTRKTIRVRDGGRAGSVGWLIRLVARLSEPARALLGVDALWAGANLEGCCAFFEGGYELTSHLGSFTARQHLDELTDRDGKAVRLDLRRLRKSVKSKDYLSSGGILDDFATGHTKAVAAARYADIDAHNELHEQAVEDGLRQALHAALCPPVIATPAGAPLVAPGGGAEPLSPAQVSAACNSEQDVFLASCGNFHDSPFARAPGEACPSAIWGCLSCPNAVFTERHLKSLVGFAAFLEAQHDELDASDWQARYGAAHSRLCTDILPAFPPEALSETRAAPCEPAGALLATKLLEVLR